MSAASQCARCDELQLSPRLHLQRMLQQLEAALAEHADTGISLHEAAFKPVSDVVRVLPATTAESAPGNSIQPQAQTLQPSPRLEHRFLIRDQEFSRAFEDRAGFARCACVLGLKLAVYSGSMGGICILSSVVQGRPAFAHRAGGAADSRCVRFQSAWPPVRIVMTTLLIPRYREFAESSLSSTGMSQADVVELLADQLLQDVLHGVATEVFELHDALTEALLESI